MGPKIRYLGDEVPVEDLIWQDPIPAVNHDLISIAQADSLKIKILDSGLTILNVFRRHGLLHLHFEVLICGGAMALELRFLRKKTGKSTNQNNLQKVFRNSSINPIRFQQKSKNKVSLADLIVLAGNAGIEAAARAGGNPVSVTFVPGRMDASQEQTDVESFDLLEPIADGFRNYQKQQYSMSAEELLIDKAHLLTLTAPEMTALIGGMRVLGSNYDSSSLGVLTDRPEKLTNDFFVNLLDMQYSWHATNSDETEFEGKDRLSDEVVWSASRVDLAFGSNSQLRALAEVYAQSDNQDKFIADFVSAWTKVMNADRFDIK